MVFVLGLVSPSITRMQEGCQSSTRPFATSRCHLHSRYLDTYAQNGQNNIHLSADYTAVHTGFQRRCTLLLPEWRGAKVCAAPPGALEDCPCPETRRPTSLKRVTFQRRPCCQLEARKLRKLRYDHHVAGKYAPLLGHRKALQQRFLRPGGPER